MLDWKFFFVNRKWLYTAVTRATELNNVVFFSGPTEELDEATLNKYLTKKVENYKKQDLEHGRAIADNFVTEAWLKSHLVRSVPIVVTAFGSTSRTVGWSLT